MRDDWPEPDDSDIDQPDEEENAMGTHPCPSCGKTLYEDADACPNCGEYISQEDPNSKKPLWLILTVAICIVAILIVWVLKSP